MNIANTCYSCTGTALVVGSNTYNFDGMYLNLVTYILIITCKVFIALVEHIMGTMYAVQAPILEQLHQSVLVLLVKQVNINNTMVKILVHFVVQERILQQQMQLMLVLVEHVDQGTTVLEAVLV